MYRGSKKGFSPIFTLIYALVSTKIPSKGEQRIVADPYSAAPAVSRRVAAVLRKVVSIKGVGASWVGTLEPLDKRHQWFFIRFYGSGCLPRRISKLRSTAGASFSLYSSFICPYSGIFHDNRDSSVTANHSAKQPQGSVMLATGKRILATV
jgi:hypothetical protein